jgi:hypothetical protein
MNFKLVQHTPPNYSQLSPTLGTKNILDVVFFLKAKFELGSKHGVVFKLNFVTIHVTIDFKSSLEVLKKHKQNQIWT